MGFPCVSLKMPQLFSVKLLLGLFSSIKLMFSVALTRLGLLKPTSSQQGVDRTPQEESSSSNTVINYVYVMNGMRPIAVPVHILTEAIKETLPVISYKSFLERLGKPYDDHEEENEGSTANAIACPVCLDYVQASDGIRELCNCCHVFHVECLDRWMDAGLGQVTCPSCRSMLFPSNIWDTIN